MSGFAAAATSRPAGVRLVRTSKNANADARAILDPMAGIVSLRWFVRTATGRFFSVRQLRRVAPA